jgi:hypothetical protein
MPIARVLDARKTGHFGGLRLNTSVEQYDALAAPAQEAWLALDDSERIELVSQYHRNIGEELPEAGQNLLHATMHVVVESQLALGILPVCQALDRLLREGLDRHDAIHAIASVLASLVHDVVAGESDDINERYAAELHELTAKSWRAGPV